MSKKQTKPEAVIQSQVCSICGLDWDEHMNLMNTSEQKPGIEECVALLLEENTRLRQRSIVFSGQSTSPNIQYKSDFV